MLDQGKRFTKQSRLKTPSDFQRVFRSGHRSVDRIFVTIATRNDLDYARLGLAISKRWVKKAVDRNRLKRLVRESFRDHQMSLAGLDVVVMTNKQPGNATNAEIFKSLQTHWQRLVEKCKPSSSS